MPTTTKQRLHACGVCGEHQPADRMIYSRHTGSRYCADDQACQRRRNRNSKPEKVTP